MNMGSIMSALRPLAYISLPLIGFRYLASKSPIVKYYWRVGVYISCVVAASIWGVCTGIILLVIGKRFDIDFWTARFFYFIAGNALGIRFEVEGEQHLDNRPAVLVGNHQSMLDLLYIGPIFPRATVMTGKKELRWVPFLGLFMMAGGNIFLDRRNPQIAVQSLREAGETMKRRKTSVWIFPEGTRTIHPEPTMKPFKKGAFHVAVQSNLPIVPVVCENYWRLYRTGVFESGTLKIRVLPPIDTTGLTSTDVADLAIRTRESMIEALREISEPFEAPAMSKLKKDSTLMPPPPPPSISITEITLAGRDPTAVDPETARQRTTSLVRSVASSEENGSQSQETEEEDGHVLVRKPGA